MMTFFKNNDKSGWAQIARYLRFRLIVPLRRSNRPPEYTARGVAIGLFWGLTPTVGIQMPLCLITWLFFKRSQYFNFSILIACAWTWVSNFFTLIPLYYGFFITGQIMRGHWNNLLGYEIFSKTIQMSFNEKNSFWIKVGEIGHFMLEDLGVSLALGCLPYALISAWLGYLISYRFIRARREKKVPLSN